MFSIKKLIKLFDSSETNFKHNKNVLSECLSAVITEDIDGTLELDLEYPLFDKKNISKTFSIGQIIKVPIYDNREDQLFKIRKITTSTSNKTVNIYAQAIAFVDLESNIILGCHIPPGTTRKKAIEMLLNSRQQKIRNYHVGNLDTSTNTNINLGLEEDTGNVINYLDIDYTSPLKGLLDESENSILKAYKGELIWNNFEINMLDKRGVNNTFTIRSGKNLQDLEKEISDMDDDFATALIMCSSDGLYLPNNEIIFSSLANKYDRYHYKVIKCDDVSLEDLLTENSTDSDIQNAQNIVYEQLRERASNYFKDGMAELLGSYTINFSDLAKSEEYKNYASLTNCSIGNEVTTIYPELDIKVTTRITKIKYNVVKDEIEEITVGNIKKDIVDTMISTENKVDVAIDEIKENKTDTKKLKVVMEKRDSEIELSIENEAEERKSELKVLDGKIELSVANEAEKRKSELKVLDDKIELSVANEAEERKSELKVLDDKIEQKVDSEEFNSYKSQTDREIKQSVKKKDFGSELTQHFDEIVATINDGTDHKAIFNSSGLTIKNGGFKIKNRNGDTIFWVDTNGVLRASYLWADDLRLDESSSKTASSLWNVLYNMESVSFDGKVKIHNQFNCPSDNFYIDGFYSLEDFIEHVVYQYNRRKGWE